MPENKTTGLPKILCKKNNKYYIFFKGEYRPRSEDYVCYMIDVTNGNVDDVFTIIDDTFFYNTLHLSLINKGYQLVSSFVTVNEIANFNEEYNINSDIDDPRKITDDYKEFTKKYTVKSNKKK